MKKFYFIFGICLYFILQNKIDAISRFTKPKYTNVKNFPYVNPNAKKGGAINFGAFGSFQSIYFYEFLTTKAFGLDLLYDSLFVKSLDEIFVFYPLIAKKANLAKDFSYIEFELNENAKFIDDSKITLLDIKKSIELFLNSPQNVLYKNLVKEIKFNQNTIKISFKSKNQEFDPEIPFIIATIKIMKINGNNIIGSGPYKISKLNLNSSIEYERNKNYWAKDLFVNKGMNNFDYIRCFYFKNRDTLFQAFLKHDIDIFFQTNWPHDNKLIKDTKNMEFIDYKHSLPVISRFILINVDHIKDINLRKAIYYSFDFDTLNRMIFNNDLQCPQSIFANTIFAHKEETKALEEKIIKIFDPNIKKLDTFERIKSDSFGNNSESIKFAKNILKNALYKIKDGFLLDKSGKKVELYMPIKDVRFEKIAMSFKESLKKIGITLNCQTLEELNYEDKIKNRQFDLMIFTMQPIVVPDKTLYTFFGSNNIENYSCIKDLNVDQLIKKISAAKDINELIINAKSFDRYIMNQYFLIPLTYDNRNRWIFYKNSINCPKMNPNVYVDIARFFWSFS